MNRLSALFFITCLVALVAAAPNSNNNKFKPTQWLPTSELQALPAITEVTLEQLERLPVHEGALLMRKLYHLSQINQDLMPSYMPSPANVPAYIVKPNGKNITANLNNLLNKVKQIPNFGQEEVTIFITGLPSTLYASVDKANQKLIQAYVQRYYGEQAQYKFTQMDAEINARTSSEEDYQESMKNKKTSNANVIVIDLGATLTNFKRLALLDVEETGNMIGKILLQLTNEGEVPREIIHIVGQGIGAHVAGVAGRQYTRMTGQKLRRITALDPSKIFAKKSEQLIGLARGDAEFVDAIHSNPKGLGSVQRVGDVDFYPNGPTYNAPGTNNIIEASMRATRYFAETVRPGNERNFPAVPASSLDELNNKNGYGKRAYMGINIDFDIKGDYMLNVNSVSPFGKRSPAEKQSNYHGVHQAWKSDN